jgi:hypothetical protein
VLWIFLSPLHELHQVELVYAHVCKLHKVQNAGFDFDLNSCHF